MTAPTPKDAVDWLDERRARGRLAYLGPDRWPVALLAVERGFRVEGLEAEGGAALGAEHGAEAPTLRVPSGGAPDARAEALYALAPAEALDSGALVEIAAPRAAVRLVLAEAGGVPLRTLVEPLRTAFRMEAIARAGRALVLDLTRAEAPASWEAALTPTQLLELAEGLAGEASRSAREAERALEEAREAGVRRLGAAAARKRRETSALRSEVRARRAELAELRRSTRYRLAHALVLAARPGRDTLRLPRRVLRLVQDRRRPAAERGPEGADVRRARERLERDVERFAAAAREKRPEHAVFMLSGTTYVQPLRANRPIRLTRDLRERGIPVLFSYHGKLSAPDVPKNEDPGLVQIPIELTEELIGRIARLDLGETKKVFVVSYPHPAVVRTLGIFAAEGWANLYDCRDDWAAFSEVGAADWYDEAIERFVVSQCDRSFAVSWPLRDKIRAFAPTRTIETSPNAYDPAFLSPGYRRQPTEEVVIGYFGHLTAKWFDWPALARVARARPRWRFEIIGHQAPAKVEQPENVVLLGPKKHPEICELAARWRAAIIPFKMSVLADAVDPIKIYEYFGLGLPVVSFRMPQIDDYPHTATVESVEDFVAALDRAVAEPVDADRLARFLAENRWSHRVDQLLRAADEVLLDPPFEKLLEGSR